MFIRLIKCIKAWILWMFIMAIPAFIYQHAIYIEASNWKIFYTLFMVFLPFLIFYENLLFYYYKWLKRIQYLILSFVLLFSEMVYKYLPWSITKLSYEETWSFNIFFVIFTLFAARVIGKFVLYKKQIVIVEKEI